jgi:hypothetical protein
MCFIEHFNTTRDYTLQLSVRHRRVLSHVAWQRLQTADVPLLSGSFACRLATISRRLNTFTHGFSWNFLEPTVTRLFFLGVKPHLAPNIRFLLLSDICGMVDVGRTLWREEGSVV